MPALPLGSTTQSYSDVAISLAWLLGCPERIQPRTGAAFITETKERRVLARRRRNTWAHLLRNVVSWSKRSSVKSRDHQRLQQAPPTARPERRKTKWDPTLDARSTAKAICRVWYTASKRLISWVNAFSRLECTTGLEWYIVHRHHISLSLSLAFFLL